MTGDRIVELEVDGNRVRGRIDGQVIEADAVEVSPGTYSLLIDGCAFEVRIEPTATGPRVLVEGREYAMTILDPRQWRRQGGSALEAEGRQKVISPMPGKIVGVLVNAGDRGRGWPRPVGCGSHENAERSAIAEIRNRRWSTRFGRPNRNRRRNSRLHLLEKCPQGRTS